MDFSVRNAGCLRWSLSVVRTVLFVVPLLIYGTGFAQDRTTPSQVYLAHCGVFYQGEFQDALKGFQQDARSSIKSGTLRWIDSICYETMAGECYYQMGMLDKALDCYTDALRLYVMYPDWMVRMNFSPTLRAAGAGSRKQVPWGVSKRPSQIGQFSSSVLMSQGKTPGENEQAVKQGGIVQQAILYPINPQEIVRCTTLAIRRRQELLGPLSKNDALTADVVAKVSGAIGPPNHWSEAWCDVERGLAYVAAGKESQGLPYLQRGILAAGEFDHPMTCVALLEIGRLKLLQNDYKGAANYFEEATYAAVNFQDYGVLEEAFRYAAITHLISNQQGLCPLLQPAVTWAKVKGGGLTLILRASVELSLAENLSVIGQSRDAAAMLDSVRTILGRRNMAVGGVGARLNYLTATVLFQERKPADGQKALAEALAYMKHGSHWLFHINLVDGYYVGSGGRAESSRTAMELYGNVLRDPMPIDWATEPMETLAVLTTPHQAAFDHWFEAAMLRTNVQDVAMEVSDRARRHRFFSSLPLGGRLESLRWVLEAPAEWLDRPIALQRQDLLTRYPDYAKLSEQSHKLREKLSAVPLVPDDKAALREQSAEFAELTSISLRQEAILKEIAVRREPADMAFPPVRKISDIKKSLPEGHAVLAFYSTGRRTYAFLMNGVKYSSWEVTQAPTLTKQIVGLLRDMNLYTPVGEVPLKDIAGEKWKQSAEIVLKTLTKSSPADFSKPLKELVIVPDGVFWYLPFEALQVKVDGKLQSLISRFRIRYAPTISLAYSPYPPARKSSGNAAIVWGKPLSKDVEAAFKEPMEKVESAISGIVPLKIAPSAPSSIYSALVNQLIVFEDLIFDDKDAFNWSPIPLDRGKPGGTLNDWLSLPWGRPYEIILPSYHTAAEDALKRLARGNIPGNDIFLSVCGLMATGTRTILLSRWRTGGESSFDLVREFVQELPHTSPADAWQRAVLLETDARLNLAAEPRVKKSPGDEAPKAEHPFFWAGYMLFDGGLPEKAKGAGEEPVNKAKPPADVRPANPLNPLPMPGEKAKDEEKKEKPENPKDKEIPRKEIENPQDKAAEK